MSNPSNSGKIKFGTDGWRGIIADDFTFSNVRKVTRAIAAYLETAYDKSRPVLIAYDTRFLADDFARTSGAVLADLGWNVKITVRDCPTPVIAYNAKHLNSAGALMFTASHNPAPYCGIKYIPDYAGPATPEITDTIVANIETASEELPGSNPSGTVSTFDPKPDYLDFIYKLLDVENCPTPVIAYNAKHLNSAGALMFTASHNPAPYCGIKYIPDYAGPATPEITDTIVANIETASEELPGSNPSGTVSTFDPKPDYLDFIYKLLDVEKIRSANLKVKYDALYSTSRGYLDEVLQYCGTQLESFHTWRDVLFGGGMPEPKGDQLVELVAAVKNDKADLGLATDGDSDRFGIVDELGNVLTPNTVLLVLARHLIKNKGKKWCHSPNRSDYPPIR